MSEIPAPQKPIPQYTIRWMLGLMTVFGVFCSIVALAKQGHLWALCISIGLGSLVLFMLIGAVLFLVIWLFSGMGFGQNSKSSKGQSPFRATVRPRPTDIFLEE
jgi:hypothetical protein